MTRTSVFRYPQKNLSRHAKKLREEFECLCLELKFPDSPELLHAGEYCFNTLDRLIHNAETSFNQKIKKPRAAKKVA